MKRFKKMSDIIKQGVRNAEKRAAEHKAYWDNLMPTLIQFDIFWRRFQTWKRQNQLL